METLERSTAAPPRRGPVLAVLLIGTFMGQFDFFVVNVAAPSLRHDLHASEFGLELIVGGYAFAYAAGLITGGRLGDLYGHRRMYILGTSGFAAASLLCGLAANPAQLVVARLVQGLTAAIMLPQVLGLITATFPAAARPRAMAWFGVASGLGGLAGQVLGGLMVTADILGQGWRLVFIVNVPVAVAAALLAGAVLPPGRRQRSSLDPVGAAGFAAAVALVLVPATFGRSVHWTWWTWVSMAAAVPVAALTLRWQALLTSRGRSPLLDLDLLRIRSFRLGLLANATFLGYFASYMFTLTLFLQTGLRLSAVEAGLVFAPTAVTYAVTARVSPRLMRRYGNAALVVGCVITATSLGGLAVLVGVGERATSPTAVAVVASLMGLGNGVVLPSLIGAALIDVPPTHAGAAAGALTSAQQFGASSGVALVGTVFFAVAESGGDGAVRGMVWSAVLDAVLVLLVGVLVLVADRCRKNRATAVRAAADEDDLKELSPCM